MITKKFIVCLSMIITLSVVMNAHSQVIVEHHRSEWVQLDKNGRLIYKHDDKGNRIPDFSHVGYMNGEKKIPDVGVVRHLEPSNEKQDDTQRIQTALDEMGSLPVDEEGFRGALLLKRGKYHIHGQLLIKHSGVVIRGEGAGEDGTILVAVGYTKKEHRRTLITVGTAEEPQINKASRVNITDDYVPVGTHRFNVAKTDHLKVGDRVLLYRPSTQAWISSIGMDRLVPRYVNLTKYRWVKDGDKPGFYYNQNKETIERYVAKKEDESWEAFRKRIPISEDGKRYRFTRQWQPGEYDFYFERIITSIVGKQITIDAPVVQALDRKYGGGAIYLYETPRRVSQVGIESLRLISEFGPPTADHPYGPRKALRRSENHGWTAILLNRNSQHTWVRHVDSLYFGYATVSAEGVHATIDSCRSLEQASKITGGRRYPFVVRGQRNLFKNCETNNGRHEFVNQKRAPGPNVFVDSIGRNSKGAVGPHHRYAIGTLYDNIISEHYMESDNQGSNGSGHGWAGVQTVFYNCQAPDFSVEAAPGTLSWVIGCGKDASPRVQPRSLYYQQLKGRLINND